MPNDEEELTEEQLNTFIEYANLMESKLQLLIKESKINLDSLEDLEEDKYMVCPLDASHRIPKESYANHMWHVHHYNTKYDLDENIDFFYESAPSLHRVHMNPQPVTQESKENKPQSIDFETLPIIDANALIPLEFYARMDPMDCDVTFNKLKQLPFTFLNIQLGFISLQRLNTQITSLFLQLNILEDQDLVNMVIALLLNRPTCHPDILVNELRQFFGSQTRKFSLELWKYLIRSEIRRIRESLIQMGDPGVIIKRNGTKESVLPPMKWEMVDEDTLTENGKEAKKQQGGIDYKRRRQSYRAKMTHLTRRSVTQEHRDMINLRMQMLVDDYNYRLVGNIDRVLTKTTPQEIENELREKRITPPELQFKDPLDARNSVRHRMKERRSERR